MHSQRHVKAVYVAILLCAGAAVGLPAQTFTTLHTFTGGYYDGAYPQGTLVQGTDGNLYGTAASGGVGAGVFFKLSPSGAFYLLHSFQEALSSDGSFPSGGLALAPNGMLYGTTIFGGNSQNQGTVFKASPSGSEAPIADFYFPGAGSGCEPGNSWQGANPSSGVIVATDGDLYGTTPTGGANCQNPPYGPGFQGGGTVFVNPPPNAGVDNLYSFCQDFLINNCLDGLEPAGGVIQATDGNFYGTTYWGGPQNNSCPSGCGTLFQLTPGGKLYTFYSFCSVGDCPDGRYPFAGLVQASDGNLYGTTQSGGTANSQGTIFRVELSTLSLTTIYQFCGQDLCPDGAQPSVALIQATDGRLYGTTMYGGVHGQGGTPNAGTIFNVTLGGRLTTLYTFGDSANGNVGINPNGLFQATNGDLYGTTQSSVNDESFGTAFSLSMNIRPFVEVNPSFGKVGTGVKILGTDLTGATRVLFNGKAAKFEVNSSTEITVQVPSGATSGRVLVRTPSGTLSSNVPFRVLK